jgi:tetratricopeptide (TPR) repeat protein
VNSDADIQKAIESIILYRVNCEKGEGKDIAKEFKVGSYPTFIVANEKGELIDIWLGYLKDEFIGYLSTSLHDLSPIEQKKIAAAKLPTLSGLVTLGRYNSIMGDPKEAVNYYSMARVLSSQSYSYESEIFENTVKGFGKKEYTYDDVNKAAESIVNTKGMDLLDKISVVRRMASIANKNEKPADMAHFLQTGLDLTANDTAQEYKQAHAELMVDFSMLVKHDTATAVEYKKATMPDKWRDNANSLNEFAWWCYENKANLEEAETLALKAVGLAAPGTEKANIYDTVAQIKYARGKVIEALENEKKAAVEDPTNTNFPKDVERFQKEISGTK